MATIKCDGSTCRHHRFGECIAESLTIRNAEIEFESDKFTDVQQCTSYEYSRYWRQYDADYELVYGEYVYKGRDKIAKPVSPVEHLPRGSVFTRR